jgi:hypothetical protein
MVGARILNISCQIAETCLGIDLACSVGPRSHERAKRPSRTWRSAPPDCWLYCGFHLRQGLGGLYEITE